MNFIIQAVIAIASVLIGSFVTALAQPKAATPEVRDIDDPTSDAGREVPVVFGTVRVKGVNILWFGEKTTKSYQVNA